MEVVRADLGGELVRWVVIAAILFGPVVRRVLARQREGAAPPRPRPGPPPDVPPRRASGAPLTWEDLLAGRVPEPEPEPEPPPEPGRAPVAEPVPALAADIEWQSVVGESALEAAGGEAEPSVPVAEPVQTLPAGAAGLAVGLPMGGGSRSSRAAALVRGRGGRRVPRAWREALLLAEVVGPPVALRRVGDGPLPPASMG